MNSHLSKARSCAWYEKGKLRALGLDNPEDFHLPAPFSEPEDDNDLDNHDSQQDSDLDMDFGPFEGDFTFLPPHLLPDMPGIGDAGPGPQTAANRILEGAANMTHPILDDDDDERVIQIDEEAGRIYRQEPPPRHFHVDQDGDSSMDHGGEPNPFFPFASELDWKVARWAVKDGPGHSAFNRLLEIPGVSKFHLFPFMLSNLI